MIFLSFESPGVESRSQRQPAPPGGSSSHSPGTGATRDEPVPLEFDCSPSIEIEEDGRKALGFQIGRAKN